MALWILAPDSTGTCCECSTDRLSACDDCTPPECTCYLSLNAHSEDSPTNVYRSYQLAYADMLTRVKSCIIDNYRFICFGEEAPSGTTTLSVTQAAGQISLSYSSFSSCSETIQETPGGNVCTMNGCYTPGATLNKAFYGGIVTVSLNLKAGSILTLSSSFSITWGVFAGFGPTVTKCTGEGLSYFSYTYTLDQYGYNIGDSYSYNITEDNVYILSSDFGITCYNTLVVEGTADYIITSTDTITANPVVALYDNPDDPETPLQLEACPVHWLPFVASLFAIVPSSFPQNIEEAQTVMDVIGVDCLAANRTAQYSPTIVSSASFSANTFYFSISGGHTDITLQTFNEIEVCFFLLAGTTITVNLTRNVSFASPSSTINGSMRFMLQTTDIERDIVDRDEAIVEVSPYVTTFTLTAPYDGKFLVILDSWEFDSVTAGPATSIDIVGAITCPDPLIICPIQVLYNVGTECPARLDCAP
jgi:hypothetical protein